MGAVRILILVVAGVAAIVLMVIVGKLISHKPTPAPVVAAAPAKPMTRVVVAAHDLQVGTRLAAQDMTWQPWPADAVNPAFITDGKVTATTGGAAAIASQTGRVANDTLTAMTGHSPMDALLGAVVRLPILANEPITNEKIVRGGQGNYMAVLLKPGMRAMSIPVTVTSDAGGFVLPGDHVDLLQARQADPGPNGQRPYVVHTLLHNIRVLAIDQASQAPKGGSQAVIATSATIEVSPDDAEIVALAKAQGDIILTLRPYTDAGGPSGAVDAVSTGTVRIIRGGVARDVMVTP